MTDVTDFTDSGTLISEDCSTIKLNTGVRWHRVRRGKDLFPSRLSVHAAHPSSPLQVNLHLQQFYAMFLKRALYSWRNWKVMVAQFLVPLVFTIVALVVARTLPNRDTSHQLDLALNRYGPTQVPVALDLWPGPLASALATAYSSQLPAQQGQAVNITGKRSKIFLKFLRVKSLNTVYKINLMQ